MLNYWLQSALASSKMSQSHLARSLSEALGRSIDRAAVNKMTSGERRLLADELLEIARICAFPLPLTGQKPSSDFERALAAILPTLDEVEPAPIDVRQFTDSNDILQITFGNLRETIRQILDRRGAGRIDNEELAEELMNGLKAQIGRRQVFIAGEA